MHQTSRDSSFEWADGSALDYANWGQGEPNNHGDDRGTEDCAGFLFDDKTWNDFHCDGTAWDGTSIGYVCQGENGGIDKSDDASSNSILYPSINAKNTINSAYIDSGANAAALTLALMNFILILLVICKYRRESTEASAPSYNPLASSLRRSPRRVTRLSLDEDSTSLASAPQVEVL